MIKITRIEKLKGLLLVNRHHAYNLQAESNRLEQIDYWLEELQNLLGETNREKVIDFVFQETA